MFYLEIHNSQKLRLFASTQERSIAGGVTKIKQVRFKTRKQKLLFEKIQKSLYDMYSELQSLILLDSLIVSACVSLLCTNEDDSYNEIRNY